MCGGTLFRSSSPVLILSGQDPESSSPDPDELLQLRDVAKHLGTCSYALDIKFPKNKPNRKVFSFHFLLFVVFEYVIGGYLLPAVTALSHEQSCISPFPVRERSLVFFALLFSYEHFVGGSPNGTGRSRTGKCVLGSYHSFRRFNGLCPPPGHQCQLVLPSSARLYRHCLLLLIHYLYV